MRHGFFRYILALVLVSLGAVLLLENIGVVSLNVQEAWMYIYPVLLAGIGLKWLVDDIRGREGSWIFGSFFLIFGSLLVLDRFALIDFSFWDVLKLWPLLIVYIGLRLFSQSSGKRKYWRKYKKKRNSFQRGGSPFSVGSFEYNKPNWQVQPMDVNSFAGDYYFDFTKAFIPEKEIPITISSLAGDVNIIMPDNVDYRVYATVKAGDIYIAGQEVDGVNRSLAYETVGYDSAIRKIDLMINLKFGSVRLDQV